MVEDVDGNVFLDCAAGIAVNSTGHSHPGRRRGDHRAGAEVPAHVGHRLLLRAAGAAGRGARRDRADSAAACGRSSATPAPRRSRRASSWRATRPGGTNIIAFLGGFHGRTHGVAVADGEQGDPAPRLRPDDAGRVPRAVSPTAIAARSGSTPETCAGGVPRLHRAPAVRAPGVARRSRRRSSSSRSRARAATSWRRTSSCSGCAS